MDGVSRCFESVTGNGVGGGSIDVAVVVHTLLCGKAGGVGCAINDDGGIRL